MLRRMVLYALCFLVYTSPVAFAMKIIRQACLDSICYFIPSDHVLKLDSALNISSAEDDELLPISVVNLDLPNIGNEDILSALGHFNAIDGVWSPTFAACKPLENVSVVEILKLFRRHLYPAQREMDSESKQRLPL